MVIIRIGCVPYDDLVKLCRNIERFCWNCYNHRNPGIDFEIMRYSFEYGLGTSALQQAELSLVRFDSIGSLVNQSNADVGYDGFIGALQNHTIDVTIPTINLYENRFQVIDYPLPAVQFDPDSFLVHPRRYYTNPPSFFTVLPLKTWLFGFATLFIMGFTMTMLSTFHEEGVSRGLKFYDYLRYSIGCQNISVRFFRTDVFDKLFSILFEKKVKHKWSTTQQMLLLTIWSFCALLGLRWFSGLYVRNLTGSGYKPPFTTLLQLATVIKHQDYRLVLLDSGSSFEQMQPESTDRSFAPLREASQFNAPVFVKNHSAALNFTAQTPASAYLASDLTAKSLAQRSTLLNIVTQPSSMTTYSFGLNKHFVYTKEFAMGYLLLHEFGLIVKIYRNYGIPLGEAETLEKMNTELTPLSLNQMIESFRILLWGLITSIVIFVVERIIHTFHIILVRKRCF